MERYKGYRVPISSIKSGSLLKKLADREQTTSDDILHSATKPDSKEPKPIGPLTSTEELLEALDLAIGSDKKDLEEPESHDLEAVSIKAEDEDNAEVTTPKKKRRTKKEIEADTASAEPKFVELTELLPRLPKKGNFEVGTVKKSLYFFS